MSVKSCWGSFAIDLQEQAAEAAENARWWYAFAGTKTDPHGIAARTFQGAAALRYETARWAAERCRTECCPPNLLEKP